MIASQHTSHRRSRPDDGARMPVYRTLLALGLAVLVGCAAQPGPAPAGVAEPESTAATEVGMAPMTLLARAAQAPPREAMSLRLQAATLYADLGETAFLAGVMREIDAGLLDPAEQFRFDLLRAQLALEGGDAARASTLLELVQDARYQSASDEADVVRAAELRARILAANHRTIDAVRERVFLDALLDEAQRVANRARIWSLLTSLDSGTLDTELASLGNEPVLRGWLELAAIALGMFPTLEAQLDAVQRWQQRWRAHPASDPFPNRIARLPTLIQERPRHVALLLPLSGPLSAAGEAVRDGFIAAQFEALAAGGAVPRLSLYDTHAEDAASAYARAVDSGAQFVVGPLDKPSVEQVSMLPVREVPVLALNATTAPPEQGMVQFGLLPEDEGVQIAERTWREGHRRALMLTARSAWADRLGDAFRARFGELGGRIVAQRSFANVREIDDAVSGGLLIGESERRARALAQLLGERLEHEPHPREDVDFVFAGADPVAARTLKPALEYYFAGQLPVYASSHVYDGGAQAEDLSGIRFCDMPWRLLDLSERRHVEAAFPDAARGNAAFYALGVDAWRLHAQLPQLGAGQRLPGMTGTLSLGADGRLGRELTWAIIRDGRALPLPRVADDGAPAG
jgi:outer membrane PBP1 activator LpoA protein